MQREMTFRGHRSLAVDLRGHGTGFTRAYQTQDLDTFAAEPSPIANVTGPDRINHVVAPVRRVREHGPVILPDNKFDVREAAGGHGTFLNHPTEVAEILGTLAP